MRERHSEHAQSAVGKCRWCGVHWPCDAARLLALVDSLERANHLNAAAAHNLSREAVAARRRLATVLATVEEVEQANGYGQRIGYTLSREQHAHDLDRIRRAATGGTP